MHALVLCLFAKSKYTTHAPGSMLQPLTVNKCIASVQVCMLTCFPKLLYNFIYRDLTVRDVLDNPAEAARWFAARDLIIAATFCRQALPTHVHAVYSGVERGCSNAYCLLVFACVVGRA
jgi:hypothetical protein